MIPSSFASLRVAGQTPAQSALTYFLSQFPATNNCEELNAQIIGISRDIGQTIRYIAISRNAGMPSSSVSIVYAKAYFDVCQAKVLEKRNQSPLCSNGSTVTNPVTGNTGIPSGNGSTNVVPSTNVTPATNVTPSTPGTPSTNPVVLVSDLTNQNQSGPKNPMPSNSLGNATVPTDSAGSGQSPTVIPEKDYFTKKNLLISGVVIVVLAIAGKLLYSKTKNTK